MDIRVVRYARLRNLGNFENERVELEAACGPEDDAERVYQELKALAADLLFAQGAPPLRARQQATPVDDELPF